MADYLDSNLFDEFGNYIGEALDSDDEGEEDGRQEYASTSSRLPGYDNDEEEEEEDGQLQRDIDVVMDEDEAISGPSNAVVLHGAWANVCLACV